MIPNKLNSKYYLPIWLGLFFATLVCNFYDFYSICAGLADMGAQLSRLEVAVYVVEMLFGDIIVPALMCVLFAFVVYHIGNMRYVRCISRKDFIYFVMLFISASRLLMGFIRLFGLLDENVFYCTSGFLSTLFNAAAMLVMFFVVFRRIYRFNPAEESNAFRIWATVFMIGGGIEALIGNGAVLLLMDAPDLLSELFGADLTAANLSALSAGCVTGIVIYVAYLIAIIVLGEVLKSKARRFTDPSTRGEYYDSHDGAPYTVRSDAQDVFGDYSATGDSSNANGSNDDNVFDEFDI